MELLERLLNLLNTSTAADLRSAAERFSALQEEPDNNSLLRMIFFCLAGLCTLAAETADMREKGFMNDQEYMEESVEEND